MKNLKSWALKSVFSESVTGKRGKAGPVIRVAGCFLTMGSLFPLSCLSFGRCSRVASAVPWERTCSNWISGRIWVTRSNSLVFVPFLTFTQLFLLRELSLTLLSFHFLESESLHYGRHSAIFPQMHLEAIGSLTVGVMLFRRCCISWAVCAKALLPVPPRGSCGARGTHVAFVLLSFSIKMQANVTSFSLLNSKQEEGDVCKVRELRVVEIAMLSLYYYCSFLRLIMHVLGARCYTLSMHYFIYHCNTLSNWFCYSYPYLID